MNQEEEKKEINDEDDLQFPDDLFSEKAEANIPNAAHQNVNEPQNT